MSTSIQCYDSLSSVDCSLHFVVCGHVERRHEHVAFIGDIYTDDIVAVNRNVRTSHKLLLDIVAVNRDDNLQVIAVGIEFHHDAFTCLERNGERNLALRTRWARWAYWTLLTRLALRAFWTLWTFGTCFALRTLRTDWHRIAVNGDDTVAVNLDSVTWGQSLGDNGRVNTDFVIAVNNDAPTSAVILSVGRNMSVGIEVDTLARNELVLLSFKGLANAHVELVRLVFVYLNSSVRAYDIDIVACV